MGEQVTPQTRHWDVLPFGSLAKERRRTGYAQAELLSVYLDRGVIRYSQSSGQVHKPSLDLSVYQLVEPGDLVLNNQQAWRGSVGVSAYTGIVSPAYVVCSLSSRIFPGFARYLFRAPSMVDQYVLASKGVGSIQRNLVMQQLRRAPVRLPPSNEQRLMARYLDNADLHIARGIQAKQKLLGLLTEQRGVISDTWLVRGGRTMPRSVKPEIPELGETPQGWNTIACRYLFREVTRHDLLATDPKMSLSLRKGLVRSSELSSKSAAESDRLNYKRCAPGDIVMNKYRAYLGAFSLATERGRITPNYTVLAPRTQLESEYFALLYATPSYQATWRRASYGVGDGMMPLYTANFYRVKSLLPPVHEIARVLAGLRAEAAAIDRALASVEREIDLLREYRMRLISDVVTGNKDVLSEAALMKDIDPRELVSVLAGATKTESDEVGEDDDAQ